MSFIGIDFGTTNSSIAVHDGKAARLIGRWVGGNTLPSVVTYFTEDDEVQAAVGYDAADLGKANPDFCFRRFKRLFGLPFSEWENHGFQCVRGDDGMVWLQGPQRKHAPSDLAAAIIDELLTAAEASLGKRPTSGVMTVPAQFGDVARRALLQAAEYARFKADIIDEPTAAAIAHGVSQDTTRTIVVFDLGGGTLDVSIIRAGGGAIDVVAKNGQRNLGGADFDRALVDYVLERYLAEQGVDLGLDPKVRVRITEAAELTKIALSTRDRADLSVDRVRTDASGVHHLKYSIAREVFDAVTSNLVQRAMATCERVMQEARLTIADIDSVILVGGMTRVPAVREAVKGFFQREPEQGIEPEEAVAIGAATYAAIQGRRIKGKVADILPQTIAVRTVGGQAYVAIPKGTPLPAKVDVTLTSYEDDQPHASIVVLQGEHAMADQCDMVFLMHDELEPARAGEPSIKLQLEVSRNVLITARKDGELVYGGADE